MTPELLKLIKDRAAAGLSETEITEELRVAGYTNEVIAKAYLTAREPDRHAALPGLRELLSLVWQMCLSEWRMFLTVWFYGSLAIVVLAGVGYLLYLDLGLRVNLVFVLFLLAGLGLPLLIGIMSFVLTRALLLRGRADPLMTHLRQVLDHFLSLLVVSIYTAIISQVGYNLLFVPGVIATIYLLFALPLTIMGESKGLSSLVMSARLVHGRFWAVLWRFMVLGFVSVVFVLFYTLVVVSSLAVATLNNEPDGRWLVTIVGLTLPLFPLISCWSISVLVVLFEMLRSIPSPVMLRVTDRSLKIFFSVVIGLVVAVLAILAFLAGFSGFVLLNS